MDYEQYSIEYPRNGNGNTPPGIDPLTLPLASRMRGLLDHGLLRPSRRRSAWLMTLVCASLVASASGCSSSEKASSLVVPPITPPSSVASPLSTSAPGYGDFTGFVIDRKGSALSQAHVTAHIVYTVLLNVEDPNREFHDTVLTDPQGGFHIVFPSLGGADYYVGPNGWEYSITLDGYASQSGKLKQGPNSHDVIFVLVRNP